MHPITNTLAASVLTLCPTLTASAQSDTLRTATPVTPAPPTTTAPTKQHDRFTLEIHPTLYGGFKAFPGAPQGVNPNFWRSGSFTLDILRMRYAPASRKWDLALNFGVGYDVTHLRNSTMAALNPDGSMAFTPYPDAAATKGRNSWLQGFTTDISLGFRHNLGREGYFGVAAVVDFPLVNCQLLRTHYTTSDGNPVKTAADVPSVFRVAPGLRAEIGVKGIGGIFVKFTPRDYFCPNLGPSGPSITTGLVLNF